MEIWCTTVLRKPSLTVLLDTEDEIVGQSILICSRVVAELVDLRACLHGQPAPNRARQREAAPEPCAQNHELHVDPEVPNEGFGLQILIGAGAVDR